MTPEVMREWRRRHGLSQTAAGELIGVSRQAVQHWESGDREIPVMAENLVYLIDRYPYVRHVLTDLNKRRYANENVMTSSKRKPTPRPHA